MPKFSVIVPVYKVEKYIAECIESVLNQTYADFELLAVDDCGGDNSIKIVEEYAKTDKRIKILTHKKNKGLAAARNTALDAAQGEYIVCLDSDDWMENNCLQVILSRFLSKKTTSIWFNAYKFYDDTKTRDPKPFYDQQEGYRELTPDTIAAYADFTWIKAYTRESIQKYNLHWPDGLTFEDGEFYFKYFTLNPKTYVISDCLINYRYREGSIVREADKGNVKMEHIYTVVRHLKEFWEEYDVYDRYKVTILKLFQNRVRMCKNLNYSDENKKLSYEFLKDLGYPNDFENFNPERNKEPLVSVVVPFYNVEPYITQCLTSIVNQTYKNIEIICVDDCGQDNSAKIVKEFAKKDKRIKIVEHRKNKGYCNAVSSGIKKAIGEFIMFVESDDFIEPDCVKCVTEKLIETNFNVVMFKTDLLMNNKRSEYIWEPYYKDHCEGKITMDDSCLSNFPYYYWNKGYKREFLLKEEVKWRNNGIFEDQEFFFRVFTNSPYTYLIDKSLYIYRIRSQSLMNQCYTDFKKVDDLFLVMKKIFDYLKKNKIFDKYKNSYTKLIHKNLSTLKKSFENNKEICRKVVDFLDNINFNNNFEEI